MAYVFLTLAVGFTLAILALSAYIVFVLIRRAVNQTRKRFKK